MRQGVRGWLAEAADALASVFFPSGCRICERLLTSTSRIPICEECLASFERLPALHCEICGVPLPTTRVKEGETLLCPDCQHKTFAFDRARSFALYQQAVVRAILLLKFEQIEPLAEWFAARLAEVALAEGEQLGVDLVVPVPLHRQREKERGYNQAALLSKPLSKKAAAAAQGGPAGAHQGTAGTANPDSARALGVRTWRICHTPGQPS